MPQFLYDYSWSHPSPEAMASVPGVVGVVRYLSGGGSKDLTAGERDALLAAGLQISLVWETSGGREEEGFGAGAADGAAAQAQANSLGAPHGIVIWFADDNNDPDPSQESAYLEGVRSTLHDYVAGQYGNGLVAQHAIDTGGYGWRVETWRPGDSLDPHLIQLANSKQPEIPGTPTAWYDTNVLNHPFPIWGGTYDEEAEVGAALDTLGQWEKDTRKEILDTLGVWLQDQSKLVIRQVNKHVDDVVAGLPAGGAAGGVSAADVRAIVRDELDKTKLAH